MNGSAPKLSCAGFHSSPIRNPIPNRSIVGIAFWIIITKIAVTISKMLDAASSRIVRNILSPKAPVIGDYYRGDAGDAEKYSPPQCLCGSKSYGLRAFPPLVIALIFASTFATTSVGSGA